MTHWRVTFALSAIIIIAGLIFFYPRRTVRPIQNAPISGVRLIEDFYKRYLTTSPEERLRLNLPFSKSFQDLIDQNSKICEEKAKGDICGWASDGDIYLNTQEVDPDLNFENSDFRIVSPEPHIVEVILQIMPNSNLKTEFSERKFRFLMKEEDGSWVVDNIIQNGISVRKLIEEEIEFYTKQDIEAQ